MHMTLVISSLNSGGAERVLSELANYWVSKNYNVSLVTLASSQSHPFYPLDLKINLIQLDQNYHENSTLKRFSNILKRIFCLRATIKELHPDVIISFIDITNITTLIATIGLKIPVIVSERTNPADHSFPKFYQKLRQVFYYKAAFVVVQTEKAANYFKDLKNIKIIPNSVPKPNNTKQFSAKPIVKKIISVGRLCPFKGFDTLIHACPNILNNEPYPTLTIYGEGKEHQNLLILINSLGLQDKIYLPGVIQNIQEVLVDADLFIFPSRYEGFPNALCEAMAVGLPVIASNCSGNLAIIEDRVNGRIFPVGDVDSLSKIMQELINDTEQCKLLSLNARKITDQFSPTKVYGMWEEIVNSVLTH